MTSADRVSVLRGVLVLVGVAFRSGYVPTGMNGLGERIGNALLAFAVTLAAGDKNTDPMPVPLPAAAQGFISAPGRGNNPLPNNQGAWLQVLIKVIIAALAGIAG